MINSLVAGNEKIDAGNLAKLKKLYQDYVFDILGLKAESESVSQDHEVAGENIGYGDVYPYRSQAKERLGHFRQDQGRTESSRSRH